MFVLAHFGDLYLYIALEKSKKNGMFFNIMAALARRKPTFGRK
jgi:hypothetical protein